MTLTARPYRDETDLQRMIELVIAITAADLAHADYHVGDMLWGRYRRIFDPSEHIQLWEQDGELVGMAWGDPAPTSYSLQVHPRYRGQRVLEPQMLAWVEQHLRDAILAGHEERTLSVGALVSDQAWIDLLTAYGYRRVEGQSLHLMRQPLPAAQSAVTLPAGWTVRPVGGEDEWPARVELHREVWQSSRQTLEAYRNIRAAVGYEPELDLVAVAPDGTLASYCICWLDPVNRIGLFEPVGTRAAFRGQGIGKAVMQTGLQRLHEHGMTSAQVGSYSSNAASTALYRSVGFTVGDTNEQYSKKL